MASDGPVSKTSFYLYASSRGETSLAPSTVYHELLTARTVAADTDKVSDNRQASGGELSIDELLASLELAVEKHRLTFLYVARPKRRNPTAHCSWETLYQDELPDRRIPAAAIDSQGEFLFEYRFVLDNFAQAAIGQFGPGRGTKPTVLGPDGVFAEIEGGSLPRWFLDEIGCHYLEESSTSILEACKRLMRADETGRFRSLIRQVRDIVHDDGQHRWYASVLVKWEYLERLDELIACIKAAEIDWPYSNDNTAHESNELPAGDALPSIPLEERRNSGLVLLLLLAQAYYKILECTISMASWCTVLDLELNDSYLWTIASLQNLLKNHDDLRDFPMEFEPAFPDLYPSTIRDHEWEDMVAPDVERFLSTVQKYVHRKGVDELPARSPGWIFVELFRPSINAAIERAVAYDRRMRTYCERMLPRSNGAHDSAIAARPSQCDSAGASTGGNVMAKVTPRRFRIALSFPGEHRNFVGEVAECLAARIGKDRVLYDSYYEAEFARVDLDTYLQQLYRDESELIVVFLCADYKQKQWCGLEWRAIRDLIKQRRASSVMPLRFDNTEIPGLFSTDGYVWIGTRNPREIAEVILQRLDATFE